MCQTTSALVHLVFGPADIWSGSCELTWLVVRNEGQAGVLLWAYDGQDPRNAHLLPIVTHLNPVPKEMPVCTHTHTERACLGEQSSALLWDGLESCCRHASAPSISPQILPFQHITPQMLTSRTCISLSYGFLWFPETHSACQKDLGRSFKALSLLEEGMTYPCPLSSCAGCWRHQDQWDIVLDLEIPMGQMYSQGLVKSFCVQTVTGAAN